MRVEIIPSALKSFTGKNAVSEIKQVMSEGEILRCTAIGKHGDTVLFANKGYSLFMAKILGSVEIMPGDSVEMIVTNNANNQYEMEVLDIFPEAAKPDGTAGKEGQQNLNTESSKQLNTQVLAAAMNILKQNPGLKPKEALFLAANKIPATPENVQVLSNLVKGESKVGTVLSQILSVIKEQFGNKSTDANIIVQDNETVQTVKQKQLDNKSTDVKPPQVENKETQTIKREQPNEQIKVIQQSKADNETGKVVQNEEPIKQQTRISVQEAKTDVTTIKETAAEPKTISPPSYEGYLKAEDEANVTKEIEKVIDLMLPKLDTKDKAKNIKKNVADIPNKLKELKILLANNDSKSKEAIFKADYLEQQQKFMSEIKRVACYQIPFMINDQTQNTAELYVYENKNKSRSENGEEFAILIGLDTQFIGRVEALIKFQHKNVFLGFSLESDETLNSINNSKKKLAEVIESTGYHLAEMSASKLERRTTVINAEEVLSKDITESNGNIDVRI